MYLHSHVKVSLQGKHLFTQNTENLKSRNEDLQGMGIFPSHFFPPFWMYYYYYWGHLNYNFHVI